MKFLTDEKLLIVGAAGMIGSNMAQTAACLGLSSNICLYDIFEPGLKGVLAEMDHCAFEGVNFTATIDPAEAFKDAKYIISSGGAPRKEGMTREDLLKGNCQIAAEFGDNIKKYCPDAKSLSQPSSTPALSPHSSLPSQPLTAPVCRRPLHRNSAYLSTRLPAPTPMVVTERLWQYLQAR